MKAITINGQIKVYSQLPKTWKNHLNFRQASVELQQQEGFFDVVVPEFNSEVQYLGEIYFDQTNQVFTYPVANRVFDLEELRNERLEHFSHVVDEFAVLIIRCQLIHGTTNQALNDAIDQTRSMQANTVAAINSIQTTQEMLAFQIRSEDIEYYKSLFAPFRM